MDLEFDKTDLDADYVSVPAGTYVCEVTEVRRGETRAGDERWSMKLEVREGDLAGRHAAWDSLVFSERARPRVRLVFAALGLPSSGRVSVEPEDLVGRRALVEVRTTEYQPPDGRTVRRNEVPYGGYRALPPRADAAPSDEMPF